MSKLKEKAEVGEGKVKHIKIKSLKNPLIPKKLLKPKHDKGKMPTPKKDKGVKLRKIAPKIKIALKKKIPPKQLAKIKKLIKKQPKPFKFS